ncbi:MAG: ABC transporter ATP-binding protein [Ruminococcaceae bacterium]|nr:ABC transporter ATP-binding protein [Oscillospiraceae bacterium]
MEEDILKVSNLHIKFVTDDDTVYAVNGLNLSVKKKTTLGLVGETGAGKTTTMLSLLGLVPKPQGYITDGEILFNGKDVMKLSKNELREMRGKDIAMIFQDPMTSLNPVMTIGEQIQEAIDIHENISKAEAEAKVKELLAMVGIPPDRFHDYPHQFSGGMKQRVVIAIALACRPALLIADEPTTALDVTIQAQVLDLMRGLKENIDMAMIMITHDLGIVAETCDEVAVMYAGKIVERGTLRDVFKNTKHPYTEGLFNSLPRMNDKNSKLIPIKGLIPDPTIEYKTCAFADRCNYATERCFKEPVSERVFSDTHSALCIRYDEPDFAIQGGCN